MRRDLAKEYAQIVADFKRDGYGVYDDGPDAHGAIALCDAYYGDGGSMVPMFRLTGKPMLLQDTAVTGGRKLAFTAICETQETLWATETAFNALYRIDKRTMSARYLGSFPGEKARGGWLFSSIHRHEGVLYFAPSRAGAIALYDCASGLFERIELPAANMPDEKLSKFTKIIEACGRLFFIPAFFPGILELDPATRELVMIDGWLKLFETCENTDLYYFIDAAADEARGRIVLTTARASIVAEMDLNTRHVAAQRIEDEKGAFMSLLLFEDIAWLLSRNRPALARLPLSGGALTVYDAELAGVPEQEPYMFQKIMRAGDDLYLLPCKDDRLVRFSMADKTFSVAEKFAVPGFRVMRTNGTGAYLQDNDCRFYAFPRRWALRARAL
jgi:hypothetical protein